MKAKWFTTSPLSHQSIIDQYSTFIDHANSLNLLTRSTTQQNAALDDIDEFICHLKHFKSQATQANDEHFANLMFCFQCTLRAVQSSIKMWTLVKDSKYEKAWSSFVDADEYLGVALKSQDYPGARLLERNLRDIRSTIFPHNFVYNSLGFTSTIGKCSICHEHFGDCSHIEGEIHWGKLCRRVDIKILDVNHAAIVTNPRDPRCIFTAIQDDDGQWIDVFTLDTPDSDEKDEGSEGDAATDGRRARGILLCTSTLDFD